MSTEADMLRLSARPRNTRSHSLKPQSQPMMQFKQRSKRTMSLPSKPVLLPLINIQRCQDNWKDESDEDEKAELNFGIVRKENGQEETEDRQLLERDGTEGASCGISSAEDEHFGACFGKGNLPGNDHSVDSPVGDDTLEITRRTELFHLNDR